MGFMGTVRCGACGHTVSVEAKICLNCGDPDPVGKATIREKGQLVLMAICAIACAVIFGYDHLTRQGHRRDKATPSVSQSGIREDSLHGDPAISGAGQTETSAEDATDSSASTDRNEQQILTEGELRPKLAPVAEVDQQSDESRLASPAAVEEINPTESESPRTSSNQVNSFGDAQWGFTFEVPTGLFVQQHPPDSDGTTMILVSAQNDEDVLLTASKNQTSSAAAKELMHEMMRENPTWKYTHKRATGNSATLSGFNGNKIFYRKSVLRDGHAIGFCIEYPRSLKAKYDDAVEMLAATFMVQ